MASIYVKPSRLAFSAFSIFTGDIYRFSMAVSWRPDGQRASRHRRAGPVAVL
jgi:hypothetical protein